MTIRPSLLVLTPDGSLQSLAFLPQPGTNVRDKLGLLRVIGRQKLSTGGLASAPPVVV